MDTERSLLNNTQSDVSEREQICCVDNAPDNQNLKFPPPNFPKPPLKKDKKINKCNVLWRLMLPYLVVKSQNALGSESYGESICA